jgi:hypothetical protein
MIRLLLTLGLILSPLAGLAAFLITYEEWEHHRIAPPLRFRWALHTAFTAAFFFLLLAVLVGLAFTRL